MANDHAEPKGGMSRRSVLGLAGIAAGALALAPRQSAAASGHSRSIADRILLNGKFTTLDAARPQVEAVAVRDGRIVGTGSSREVTRSWLGTGTEVVDLEGRRVIPGLIDSHAHPIRAGLSHTLELDWSHVRSVNEALSSLRQHASAAQEGQWVRVVGGFSKYQFREQRLPTLAEINAAVPDVPVFVLHLYDRALLNRAAVNRLGLTADTPTPNGGWIERDAAGNPTGLLVAQPDAAILYGTIAQMPVLDATGQELSTRRYFSRLNAYGITGAIDAGGGGMVWPDSYRIVDGLHERNELTLRLAFHGFPRPGHDYEDLARYVNELPLDSTDPMLKSNGVGEVLVFSALDFEDFFQPRPELPAVMESQLEPALRLLVENNVPFRIHATYDESIKRVLKVLETVRRDVPGYNRRWIVDHAETATRSTLDRIAALGGSISVQHRMVYQGVAFAERYGTEAALHSPPIGDMIAAGVPWAAGTDSTRASGDSPWTALWWLVTGKVYGGARLLGREHRVSRIEALRAWTGGGAWMTSEEDSKGRIAPGYHADLAVLNADYFSVNEDMIPEIRSDLTMVAGRIVHGAGRFTHLAPPPVTDEAVAATLTAAAAGGSVNNGNPFQDASSWTCAC
ncbi:amidohydrolase [Actinacidiphila glaucinigra]|uniref:amidohydrolase n=1 Tax=Actinacidiphila glaucinigra TaxID=235986 RepID=UPI003D930383